MQFFCVMKNAKKKSFWKSHLTCISVNILYWEFPCWIFGWTHLRLLVFAFAIRSRFPSSSTTIAITDSKRFYSTVYSFMHIVKMVVIVVRGDGNGVLATITMTAMTMTVVQWRRRRRWWQQHWHTGSGSSGLDGLKNSQRSIQKQHIAEEIVDLHCILPVQCICECVCVNNDVVFRLVVCNFLRTVLSLTLWKCFCMLLSFFRMHSFSHFYFLSIVVSSRIVFIHLSLIPL